MNKHTRLFKWKNIRLIALLIMSLFSASCNSQEKIDNTATKDKIEPQIGNYVICAYEDSKGSLWFGTLESGIARYNGKELTYFTEKDGLPSNRTTSVTEDAEGVFWFNTGDGLSKLDQGKFTTYRPEEDDWQSNIISQFFIDSKGRFWVGTWGGVYQFDGMEFTPFAIPHPEIETTINKDTKNWITEINEDSDGNIWFARDGFGACKYDGVSFTHFLKKDGLHSNNVTEIEFDDAGNIWIGTRIAEKDNPDPTKRNGTGGVNKMENGIILSFPEIEGFNKDDVYGIYKDNVGHIWVSTSKHGVYKYNGTEFIHYQVPISITGMTVDQKGVMWLAGAGGLYKINQNEEVVNVTQYGPWR